MYKLVNHFLSRGELFSNEHWNDLGFELYSAKNENTLIYVKN